MIEVIQQCPRQAQYAFLNKRVLGDKQVALNFGGGMHEALRYRYETCPDLVSSGDEAQQYEILAKHFCENELPMVGHRTLELAQALITGYNRKYQGETFSVLHINGKPAVELPFPVFLEEFKVGNDIIKVFYCGKIDLVVKENDQMFVLDHKTTSIMGDGFFRELSVSPQMEGYCWALQQTLEITPMGWIVNAIRVPRPEKRENQKPRKLLYSNNNGIVIVEDDFQRGKTFLREGQLEEWKTNLIALIEEFFWHHSRGYLPLKRKACVHKYGQCQFFDVCCLPKEHREIMLSSGVYVENTWTPLRKPLV